ncbi:glycine--tRNA ligase subunit alpha [Buchnera aphidicola (Kurisakia onigurumii)]|uniref:glycine--tRNA ligase subunit alpha n=1 Tax=Buchnera aphidicola TaxID=9 RepID=UPI0031B6CC4B
MSCKIDNSFYTITKKIKNFWYKKGLLYTIPIDISVGAGTFHPETFFKSLGSKSFSSIYIQPCRRPTDGRYGCNPNRLQHYYQLQVVIKPPPKNIQKIYLESLKIINIFPDTSDIRFIEDNWENPTLGASGIGWEVWIDGMEMTQFTYFQNMGSIECNPITVEITYGIERICMYIQNKKSIYDIIWMQTKKKLITYGQLFHNNEIENSKYNFINSDTKLLFFLFHKYINESKRLLKLEKPLINPAYEYILHATHNFNLLDSKKTLSVTERQDYIFQLRKLSKLVAQKYLQNQEK